MRGSALLLMLVAAAACGRSSAAERRRGQELFRAVCARCHGDEGGGGAQVATGQRPRNFRDAAFQSGRTDADIRTTIKGGKPPGMPSFERVFSDAEIDALVQHVRTFDPRNAQ
jgi:mono/diheme cytochrome c family protein